MKAHGLRKVIWIANLALGAALVGVAAWYFVDVKEAVAKVLDQNPRKPPEQMRKLVDTFEGELALKRADILKAPVEEKALRKFILREDYKKKDPTHWIFSGPMPPLTVKSTDTGTKGPPAPEGLDALGEIGTIILYPPQGGLIVFKFKDGKRKHITVGEFVRSSPDRPGRFKLTEVQSPEDGLFKFIYEVYESGKDDPIRTDELVVDRRKTQPGPDSVIHIIPRKTPEAGTGTTAAVPGAAPGDTGDGTDDPTPGVVEEQPAVVTVGGPAGEVRREDMKPEITKLNARQYDIKFDSSTHRYFKGKNARALVEQVKTQEALDPSGKSIGIRIVDPGDAPADVFDIRRGDILVSINGQPVASRSDVIRIAESLPPETSRVTVVVDRYGKKITYNIDPRDPKNRRRAATTFNR